MMAGGNLTAVGGSSYAYDVQNRLTSGPGASFLYDPLERLDTVVTPSTQTRFVYSGSQLIAELDGGNTILRRYVPGVQEDRPLIWYEGTTDYRYRRPLLQDERGSVVASSNDYGSHWENSYDEYGVPASGNIGRFQYTGQLWIPEAGLYYYKARFYAPTLGRFMQTDPIGYADGMNWYAYVGNDPLNEIDSLGTEAACVTLASGCGASAPGRGATAEQAGAVLGAIAGFVAAAIDLVPGDEIPAAIAGGRAGAEAGRSVDRDPGLAERGYKPASGERTIQGQAEQATAAGNPTVSRNGQELFRLRSSGHGSDSATVTPQNQRNVNPHTGEAFMQKGPDRSMSPRDVKELYKAQDGQNGMGFRTLGGR